MYLFLFLFRIQCETVFKARSWKGVRWINCNELAHGFIVNLCQFRIISKLLNSNIRNDSQKLPIKVIVLNEDSRQTHKHIPFLHYSTRNINDFFKAKWNVDVATCHRIWLLLITLYLSLILVFLMNHPNRNAVHFYFFFRSLVGITSLGRWVYCDMMSLVIIMLMAENNLSLVTLFNVIHVMWVT